MQKKSSNPGGHQFRLWQADTRGFTLTEMMVTVGIVGLLAAISIPSYQTYSARSRSAEAKAVLASIYTSEKNFATDTATYTYCLYDIGVGGRGGTHYYGCGIQPPNFATDNFCGKVGGSKCDTLVYDDNAVISPCTTPGYNGVSIASSAFPVDENTVINSLTPAVAFGPGAAPGTATSVNAVVATGASNTQFTAGCAGNVSSLSGYDNWEINDLQQLTNTRSGL